MLVMKSIMKIKIKRYFSYLSIFRFIFFLRCFYIQKKYIFFATVETDTGLFSLETFSFQTKGIMKTGKQLGCQKNEKSHKQSHLKLICYIITYSVSLYYNLLDKTANSSLKNFV
jgi:hypothetical protein